MGAPQSYLTFFDSKMLANNMKELPNLVLSLTEMDQALGQTNSKLLRVWLRMQALSSLTRQDQ